MNVFGKKKLKLTGIMTVLIAKKFVKMVKFHWMFVLILFGCVQSSVIRLDGEKAHSLYDDNDKVFVLTNDNFYQTVFDQPYGSNVEFYNSFCGFCRNFAPIYKAFADDVYGWRDLVRISAIDCADDANNDICRDMEIMRYPTLKYFPPFYRNETNHLGIEVIHAPMTVGEPHLLELIANSSTPSDLWSTLQPIESLSLDSLFASLPSHIQYIFMVYDPKNESIIAQKVALDLRAVNSMQMRRVVSISTASKLGLNDKSAVYVGVKHSNTIESIQHLDEMNRANVRSVIERYLKSKGIEVNVESTSTSISKPTVPVSEVNSNDLAIIEYVKANPQMVFQSDLESAIRFAIFHELVKYNHMNNEQIAALKGFLAVLQKYVKCVQFKF